MLALAWLAWLMAQSFPWPIGTWMLLALGFAVALSAVPALGDSLTADPIPNERGLKTGGVYRWIRHPMYLGLLFMGLGTPLANPSAWWPLALLTGALAGKIVLEERHLASAYPDFADYARRTKRLIPYVW